MNGQNLDLAIERETYCEMFGIEPESVDDDCVKQFFVQHAKEHLERLKAGYLQMADINTEITHDFSSCESECEEHVLEWY